METCLWGFNFFIKLVSVSSSLPFPLSMLIRMLAKTGTHSHSKMLAPHFRPFEVHCLCSGYSPHGRFNFLVNYYWLFSSFLKASYSHLKTHFPTVTERIRRLTLVSQAFSPCPPQFWHIFRSLFQPFFLHWCSFHSSQWHLRSNHSCPRLLVISGAMLLHSQQC